MTRKRPALLALLALALLVTLSACDAQALWFPRSTLDRVSPFAEELTVWAAAPEADAYVDAYDDATGAYRNYVYELSAADAEGDAHEVYLISFGGTFDDAEPGSPLELSVKGCYVKGYAAVEAADVADAARGALG